jgi:hypothetical protein
MQFGRIDNVEVGRLRVVFDDAIISLNVAADANLEEISQTVGGLSTRRYGGVVAVQVILATPARPPRARGLEFLELESPAESDGARGAQWAGVPKNAAPQGEDRHLVEGWL